MRRDLKKTCNAAAVYATNSMMILPIASRTDADAAVKVGREVST
jgi:hypothetical protein